MAGRKSPKGAYNPNAGGGGAPKRGRKAGRRSGARQVQGQHTHSIPIHQHLVYDGGWSLNDGSNYGVSGGGMYGENLANFTEANPMAGWQPGLGPGHTSTGGQHGHAGPPTGLRPRGRKAARRTGARQQQGPHTHQYHPAPQMMNMAGLDNLDMRRALRHKHGDGPLTQNNNVDWDPYMDTIGFTNPVSYAQTTLSPGGTHQHGLSTGPGNTQMGTQGGGRPRGRGRPAAKRRAPRRKR